MRDTQKSVQRYYFFSIWANFYAFTHKKIAPKSDFLYVALGEPYRYLQAVSAGVHAMSYVSGCYLPLLIFLQKKNLPTPIA
jgi:hypothetical protein